MAADADKAAGQARLCRLGQVDDLGDVCQIVAGKRDEVRPPLVEEPEKGGMVLDLQVDQLHRVAGAPRRLGDEFETERLQSQKYSRIEQRTGMNAEKPHGNPLLSDRWDRSRDNRAYRD